MIRLFSRIFTVTSLSLHTLPFFLPPRISRCPTSPFPFLAVPWTLLCSFLCLHLIGVRLTAHGTCGVGMVLVLVVGRQLASSTMDCERNTWWYDDKRRAMLCLFLLPFFLCMGSLHFFFSSYFLISLMDRLPQVPFIRGFNRWDVFTPFRFFLFFSLVYSVFLRCWLSFFFQFTSFSYAERLSFSSPLFYSISRLLRGLSYPRVFSSLTLSLLC